MKYTPFLGRDTPPPTWLNNDTLERYRPEMKKFYYDPSRYETYLEQLGSRIRRFVDRGLKRRQLAAQHAVGVRLAGERAGADVGDVRLSAADDAVRRVGRTA